MRVVVKERICRQCGISFMGGPRAWYCPECREKRKEEAQHRYKSNKRAGKTIVIGETVRKCAVCGEQFIMMSAQQKYCKQCADDAIKAVDNAQGRKYMSAERAIPERNEILKERKRLGPKKCIVCGKTYTDITGGKQVCSKRCQKILTGYNQAKCDYKRGKQKSLLTWNEWIEKRNRNE